ncbi:hypothetical protein OJF2_00730 [Aquisphaera giovannonii]|uniref:PDZ domain-containing protein n=1 Tax=Aquisphaera giovannonii TaxID=406548 RepID=A0A5B9VTK5_9BACT|nr:hypothetical protein [Aquisphaera giovannonii]QEH31608.1 hypothetical protein OJF2_00730 [Aquisphaera giovannonii]
MGPIRHGATFAILISLLGGAVARGQSVLDQVSDFGREAAGAVGDAGARLDKERLKIMSPTPRPGRDYTKVYLHNQTNRKVFAAILYVHFETSGQSLSTVGGGDDWTPLQWFALNPNERVHVANTRNANVYYYAKDGAREWAGDLARQVRDGSELKVVKYRIARVMPFREESDIAITERGATPIANAGAGLAASKPPETNFKIDGQGRVTADGRPLGQARRVQNRENGRAAWRYDIPNGWSLIRYDGSNQTERHMYRSNPVPTAMKLNDRGEAVAVTPAPAAVVPTPAVAVPPSEPSPAAFEAGAPPPRPDESPGAGETFAAGLGIYYERVDYGDGTFGARLTRDAAPGTPAGTLGLEKGDTIFALDGLRFRTPEDVLNHRAQTTIDFVNIRTGAPQNGSLVLP